MGWGLLALTLMGAHYEVDGAALKSLHDAGQHAELLEKATEVAPKDRGAEWKKLVLGSATVVARAEAQGDAFRFWDGERERLKRFPHLMGDDDYRVVHERGVRDATEACFARLALVTKRRDLRPIVTWSDCARRGAALVDDERTHEKALVDVSRVLWRHGDRENAAVALDRALSKLRGAARETRCEDEHTERVVERGLHEAHDTREATAGRNIAFRHCREVFVPEVKGMLARETEGPLYDNACPELLRAKRPPKLIKKRCQRASGS